MVTETILNAGLVAIPLEEILTELDEVVVTPYSLTGTLGKDKDRIKVKPVVTASTLGLRNEKIWQQPNGVGKVIKFGKYGRIVIGFDTIKLQPEIIPEIYLYQVWKELSGTNNELKKYAALEKENALLEDLKLLYTEPVFVEDLKIPEEKINDFMNYCAADNRFAEIIDSENKISLWNFIKAESIIYRKDNGLD